jgi:hypothetical protein
VVVPPLILRSCALSPSSSSSSSFSSSSFKIKLKLLNPPETTETDELITLSRLPSASPSNKLRKNPDRFNGLFCLFFFRNWNKPQDDDPTSDDDKGAREEGGEEGEETDDVNVDDDDEG